MQTYTVAWYHLQPDPPSGRRAGDEEVYFVADVEARIDKLETALQRIVQWADAYPLDLFPEPDFKLARHALERAGLTLDAVSASNMRHVVTGVGKIARDALAT